MIVPPNGRIDAVEGQRSHGAHVNMVEGVPTLTRRELQILERVALGYSAKEIAQQCGIAHRTVEAHLDTVRLKLRARNRTHMVAIAIDLSLLSRSNFQPTPPLAARRA